MGRITEPATLFQLRTQLVETFSPDADSAIILHELRSLRREALTDPKLTADYFAWLRTKAGSLGVANFARQEFTSAWAEGTGPLPAGVALASWYMEAKDSAAVRPVLAQLLARPDANARLWDGVLQDLQTSGFTALASPVYERLTQLSPLENGRVVAWANALNQAGQRKAALATLDRWGMRAWLDGDFAGEIAQSYAELGVMDKAEDLFSHAIQQDLPRRNYETLLNYARIQRERGNLAKAHHLLGIAFLQPASRDYGEVVARSVAAGRLYGLENVLYSLELPPSSLTPARQALFTTSTRCRGA